MPIRRTDTRPVLPNTAAESLPVVVPTHENVTPAANQVDANPFERGNVVDLVNARGNKDAPSGGQSVLATRLDNATVAATKEPTKIEVALDEARALVPSIEALQGQGAATLGRFLKVTIAKALTGGEDRLFLDSDDLKPLLKPIGASEGEVAKALVALGYDASEAGAMSGGIVIKLDPVAMATGDKTALAEALVKALPSPPSSASAGNALGELITRSMVTAASRGENEASLETADLDRVLKPLGKAAYELYDDVAKMLKDLGYQSSSDGFVGVSFGWDAPAKQNLAAAALAKTFGEVMPRAEDNHPGPASLIVDLVKRKIAEAGSAGVKNIDLSTQELDAILRPAFRSDAYGTIAEALTQKGFSASSDGFIGVFAGWEK